MNRRRESGGFQCLVCSSRRGYRGRYPAQRKPVSTSPINVAVQKQSFTLWRMMLGVTVVAVVLALARAFPVFVVQFVTVNLLLAAPALSVLSVATWLSNNRRRTLIVIGAQSLLDG